MKKMFDIPDDIIEDIPPFYLETMKHHSLDLEEDDNDEDE
jgi:hypothetical protein